MPSKLLAAVAAAAILAPALPSSAISVSVVENSGTRFAFDVVWGFQPSSPLDVNELHSPHFITVIDRSGLIGFGVTSPFVPGTDVFSIEFTISGSLGRGFESDDLQNFNGAQASALPLDAYGARFVYGAPFPVDPPTGVPDHGASALLLSAGLAGLTLLRRTVV